MRQLLRAVVSALAAVVVLPLAAGVSASAEPGIAAYFDDNGIAVVDAPSSTAAVLFTSEANESATVYCSQPDPAVPSFIYYKTMARGTTGWVFSRAIKLRNPSQAVPACAAQTGTSLNITVTSTMEWLVGDPARSAYVRLTVTVKNPDGTPARFANIKVSTMNRRTFQTDRSGVWSNTVPIVLPPLGSADPSSQMLVDVTATSSAGLIARKQGSLLWITEREVTCAFAGLPSSNFDFFTSAFPPPFDSLYEALRLVPGVAGFRTEAKSYLIKAGTSGQVYARQIRVYRGSRVLLDTVSYSARQLQKPPQSEYEALMTSCRGLDAVGVA